MTDQPRLQIGVAPIAVVPKLEKNAQSHVILLKGGGGGGGGRRRKKKRRIERKKMEKTMYIERKFEKKN